MIERTAGTNRKLWQDTMEGTTWWQEAQFTRGSHTIHTSHQISQLQDTNIDKTKWRNSDTVKQAGRPSFRSTRWHHVRHGALQVLVFGTFFPSTLSDSEAWQQAGGSNTMQLCKPLGLGNQASSLCGWLEFQESLREGSSALDSVKLLCRSRKSGILRS